MTIPFFTHIRTGILVAGMAGLLAPSVALAAPTPVDENLEEQLLDDISAVPAGMGAIMVPTLTGATFEPEVIVYSGGDRVATGRPGTRIVVPPGRYEVFAGHGDLKHRAKVVVDVIEGQTAAVEPFYGAVRVHLVNSDGEPVEGSYVLRSKDTGQVFGPVSMSSEPTQRAATWILPPGRYILASGTDKDADDDAFAFPLHTSDVLRYRLVLDSGSLVRADLSDEEFHYEPSIWRFRWTVGASGALDSRNDQLVQPGRDYLLASLFSRMTAGIDTGRHLALLNFNMDQSAVGLGSSSGLEIPLQNLQSMAEAELLYALKLGGVIGPYARANFRASYLETHYFPDENVVINTRSEGGALVRRTQADTGDRVRLFEAFSPFWLQQGIGASLSVVENDVVNLSLRAGISARQAFYQGGRFVSSKTAGQLNLVELDDRIQFGGEATAIAGLRVSKALTVNTKFDSFLPTDLFAGDSDRFPFRWDTNASLRVSKIASATYNFSLRRDEVAIDHLQMVHGLSVTIQATIF